jgi:N-acetylglucosamine-6-sulfatase
MRRLTLLATSAALITMLVAGLLGGASTGTTVGLANASPATVPAAAAPRPNVLVIETDDMRVDDLRFMPRTRRLVQQRGLTFENSFAPTPLCCPSRASLLSGQFTHNHRVYTHHAPYGFSAFRDRATLATTLRRSGYRTAMVGKYLNGFGVHRLKTHHGRLGQPSTTYVPPGWTRWLPTVDQGTVTERSNPGGTYQYFLMRQNVDGRLTTTRGYNTDVMGAQVRELTDGFGRSRAPWFVWWNPVAPHHGLPREPDDPELVSNDDGGVTRFLTPARPGWVKGRFDRTVTRAPGVTASGTTEADVSDKPRGQRSDLNAAERQALTQVTRQRAEALFALDRQIGITLNRLQRTPHGRRTIVVFTSDNGYYLGEHRIRQGKGSLYEPSVRVPLLVAGPGIPRGTRYDPAMTVDLAPTIAGWARTRMPDADGVDLRGVIRSGDRGWRRPVLLETRLGITRAPDSTMPDTPLDALGLRLGRWSLTWYADGATELYDLEADPLQHENLAQRPDAADTRDRLLQVLRERATCRTAACHASLPPGLALAPAENRALTLAQQRARQAYYG